MVPEAVTVDLGARDARCSTRWRATSSRPTSSAQRGDGVATYYVSPPHRAAAVRARRGLRRRARRVPAAPRASSRAARGGRRQAPAPTPAARGCPPRRAPCCSRRPQRWSLIRRHRCRSVRRRLATTAPSARGRERSSIKEKRPCDSLRDEERQQGLLGRGGGGGATPHRRARTTSAEASPARGGGSSSTRARARQRFDGRRNLFALSRRATRAQHRRRARRAPWSASSSPNGADVRAGPSGMTFARPCAERVPTWQRSRPLRHPEKRALLTPRAAAERRA